MVWSPVWVWGQGKTAGPAPRHAIRGFPCSSWEGRSFRPWSPTTDWMWPTQLGEGHPLYSVHPFRCSTSPSQTHPESCLTKFLGTPWRPAHLTHKMNHHDVYMCVCVCAHMYACIIQGMKHWTTTQERTLQILLQNVHCHNILQSSWSDICNVLLRERSEKDARLVTVWWPRCLGLQPWLKWMVPFKQSVGCMENKTDSYHWLIGQDVFSFSFSKQPLQPENACHAYDTSDSFPWECWRFITVCIKSEEQPNNLICRRSNK